MNDKDKWNIPRESVPGTPRPASNIWRGPGYHPAEAEMSDELRAELEAILGPLDGEDVPDWGKC